MTLPVPIYHVDAFTELRFGGNPAAVCVLDAPADPAWMQTVAAEMNLSETAFLHPAGEGWSLRWFTPKLEVKLCGHATLASAHTLWESGRLSDDQPVQFDTQSGRLTAWKEGPIIVLDFPAKPATPCAPPRGLEGALGIEAKLVARSEFDYLVELPSADAVRSLHPDFGLLSQLPIRGVIVTSAADDPGCDFVSRFFAPAAGVNEDPVTGSAHCTLGPFWADRLGKTDLTGWQASARGGRVRVSVRPGRVGLGGQAVTVLRGELV